MFHRTLLFFILAITASTTSYRISSVAFQMHPSVSSPVKMRTRTSKQENTCMKMVPDAAATLSLVSSFWNTSPYTAAALTCGLNASAADYVAQKRDLAKVATRRKTDLDRTAAFLLYGAIYQGMGQEYIYNQLYPILFGASTSFATVLSKVLFDLLIQTTLLTLPIAYMSKAIVYKYSIKEAFLRYKDDVLNHGLLAKYFLLWGPVQCITFSIIPSQYRVTFIASVSFFWMTILSSIASKARNVESDNVN
eukprot:15324789-Ditylum_brightwellii.AAC.2